MTNSEVFFIRTEEIWRRGETLDSRRIVCSMVFIEFRKLTIFLVKLSLCPCFTEVRKQCVALFWNIIIFCNGEVDLLYSSMLQKILIMSKNASNKNCAKLNFPQKTQQTHMSISARSGAGCFKDCPVWNIIIYSNGKVHSLYGSMLQKMPQVKIAQD